MNCTYLLTYFTVSPTILSIYFHLLNLLYLAFTIIYIIVIYIYIIQLFKLLLLAEYFTFLSIY